MSVRTTLTLDEDVFERLKHESRTRGIPFRQAVNDALRTGLLTNTRVADRETFQVHPVNMGELRPGLNLDCISALLDELEGPLHR
jgi:hypothetical protein